VLTNGVHRAAKLRTRRPQVRVLQGAPRLTRLHPRGLPHGLLYTLTRRRVAGSLASSEVRVLQLATDVTDEQWMRYALNRALQAGQLGEVPIGAVVVMNGELVAEGFNEPIRAHDPTAHAEIVAMRRAATQVGNYRLIGATLYVTIEPCQMCVGAMVHARISRLVYGAPEPKAGAIESAMHAHEHPSLNHRIEVRGHVLEEECRAAIQAFFRDRRDEQQS